MLLRRLVVALLLASASAQLRPRRVGTNALGEQVDVDVPSAAAGGGAGGGAGGMGGMGGMEGLLEAMQAGGGFDPATLMNNPMMKGMMDANPEVAKMLGDPDAMKEQMGKMFEMMATPEGQEMTKNLMGEMQQMLTDPEKLKEGLSQLSTNPALKGLADAVPGLRDVLDNPEQLEEQAAKTAEMFSALRDPEAAQAMLAELAGDEGMEGLGENLKKLTQAMQGGDGAASMASLLSDMMGGGGADGDADGDGDDLKARVREQLAAMMQERGGGEEEAPAALGDFDEEF